VAKLIFVSDVNNNKFYDMVENDDGSITATWGRVDVTSTVTHYPVGKKKWETLLKSKLKKGYVDVTHLRAASTTKSEFAAISNRPIAKIVADLQAFANKSVKHNYTISAEAVTPQMVKEAQRILDELVPLISKGKKSKPVNDRLLELYQVIPRKMKKVQHHLLDFDTISSADNVATAEKLLATEQATLDVMQGQVKVATAQQDIKDTTDTILDAMGIDILEPSDADIQEVKKHLGRNQHQFKACFRVINKKTQSKFDKFVKTSKNKTVRRFWHGSRNENWWSIIEKGLILRPINAVITGAMYGKGLYFSPVAQKSIGYTSLRGSYWTGGTSTRGFMALYSVHLGNYLKIPKHGHWCYDLNSTTLKRRGAYDSVFAPRGTDLRNDEYIVYAEAQCTVNYLVELA
jgi:poly [ADP-ribose] polymerase